MMEGWRWDRSARYCINIYQNEIMCLAVPGKIIELKGNDPLFRLGMVNFGGIIREVNLSCVPEAGIGDYVVVHVGIALSRIEEKDALRSLEEMRNVVLIQEGEGCLPSELPLSSQSEAQGTGEGEKQIFANPD